MSTKNKQKTALRYKVNTFIFVAMAILFVVLTVRGAIEINKFSKNFQPISDAPGICYDETSETVRENSYVCTVLNHDENGNPAAVTTDNEYALFFYDQHVFAGTINAFYAQIVIIAVGMMLTGGSLLAALIYWTHNCGKQD